MEVVMSPELEQLVQRKVRDGEYSSPTELFDHALRLLDEYDRLGSDRFEDLKSAIALGIEQLESGQFIEYDDSTLGELISEIRAEGRSHRAKP